MADDDVLQEEQMTPEQLANWRRGSVGNRSTMAGVPQTGAPQMIDPRVQKVREKAQFDAENFEKRYTVKQKARTAQLKQADSMIDSHPSMDDSDKAAAHGAIAGELVMIQPQDLPRSDPYPKGKSMGQTWKENGVLMTRNKDGVPTGVPHQNSGPDYLAAKAKYNLHNMQFKYHQENHRSMRDILKDNIFEVTTDADGNEMRRKRSNEELRDIAQSIDGTKPQEQQQQQQQQEQPQQSQGELPKILPTPGYDYKGSGWGQKENDAKEDREFLIRHGNDPHAQDKLDEMRQHRSDHRDLLQHQKDMEEVQTKRLEKQQAHEKRMAWQAHHTELVKRRAALQSYRVPDDKQQSGYRTEYRSPHLIDKMMMDELGETGKETYEQHLKSMDKAEQESRASSDAQGQAPQAKSGQKTVPMPKSATWIHFSDWDKAKADWNDDSKVPPGSWVVLPDGSKKHKEE
jgi:hypothetical protein